MRRAIIRGELPASKRHGVFHIALSDLETWHDRRASGRSTVPAGGVPYPPALLPQPVTSLVGRERELATAVGMLRREDVRLLTLTGAGGVGKTRLALRIAVELRPQLPDGVWFIPLAGLSEPGQVPGAIATALGVLESGARSWWDALIARLREMEALLVLDNFEHLIEAAPELVALLQACPRIRLLVTSQFLLRVSGEHALPVPPLAVPASSEASPLDAAAAPAVRLFAERARAVDPAFVLDEVSTPVVVEICHLVDGLPLAIELAAARANALPLTVLRDRLDQRLLLLTGGARDAPPRHRTMRDAIAWSYDLLSPDEQAVVRRLAVFAGSFTFDAAEAVGGHHDRVTDIIGSLVDKSLLRRDLLASGDVRLRMPEPIHAFALEQLAARGELDATYSALADWYLALIEPASQAWIAPGGERHLTRLETDQADIRRVLEWLHQHGDGERMLRLVVALGGYWYERNHYRDGRLWTARALDTRGRADPAIRARASAQLGLFLGILGEQARAEELAARGVALLRHGNHLAELALALIWQGAIAMQGGAPGAAEAAFDEALGLAASIADVSVSAPLAARAMSNLGTVAHARGDLDVAARWHGRALDACRTHGYVLGSVRALCDLADVDRDRGEHGAALASYHASLSVLGDRSDLRIVTDALEGVALAAVSWGRGEQAVRLLGAAAGLAEAFGVPKMLPQDQSAHDLALQATRAMMDARRFDELFAAGRRLAPAEAIAEVLAVSPPSGVEALARVPGDPLTRRERDVLRLLATGLRDREIAEALFISVRTVQGHVSRVYEKLGVRSRAAATRAAIDLGLVAAER